LIIVTLNTVKSVSKNNLLKRKVTKSKFRIYIFRCPFFL